ncbi:hypothetical protein ASF13_16340 [Erwinia sp. Leaf53]|nr:hypothetical protein ASF13_16340 [Erwinia sp. Leaf53]
MIGQFSRERLEALIDDEDCRATVSEQETFAEIVLALQNAPGKIYQIRKLDGSEEWQQWEEVDEGEYHASVNYEGWGRRVLYGAPATSAPDGWKLVPVDATRKMIDAAKCIEEDGYDAMHKAMLAAAPIPGGSDAN